MSPAGKNSEQNVIAVIPARLASTRLPGKLLLPLAGKPLILWTVERAAAANNVDRVIVAADDERIATIVRENGGEAVMTAPNHQSGSDRIAEVAESLPHRCVIVNLQGDEPMISPATIERAVDAMLNSERIDIVTTCERIENTADVLSPDVVKVVTDSNGNALYFSRAPMPFPREAVNKHGGLENALQSEAKLLAQFKKHTGLYVYRREFLLEYTKWPQSGLEKTESLEQLRALENGAKIKVIETEHSSIGVDTREDYEGVRKMLEVA